MNRYFLVLASSIISVILCGLLTIPMLKRVKAGQTILKYVDVHKDKNGTPTMGGLFFVIPSIIVFFIFNGANGRIAIVSTVIGLAYMLVGFLDDYLKIKFKQNEGLKAYQKILFQLGIALVAGFFAYYNGITVFHLPFTLEKVDLNVFTIPIVSLIFIAITNCVNLTDGLDGLAGSVSLIYLFLMTIIISLQMQTLKNYYIKSEEYHSLNLLSVSLMGGILGFLVFNTNRASIFMGDTGSLSLGGFIGAISIFSSNSFFIPIIGIMFVLSGISVIVQVTYFKFTKKRVFLMAPLHHHFQLAGHSESKIVYGYSLVTLFCGLSLVLVYL